MLLLDEITKGISKVLKERFPEKKIYVAEVPQDFVEPCFFIKLLKLDEKQVFGERYFRRYFFDIRYFPDKSTNKSRDIWNIVDILQDILELITLPNGSLIRGTGRNAENEDDILHYFISYNMYVIKKKKQEEYMETLEQKQHMKGSE